MKSILEGWILRSPYLVRSSVANLMAWKLDRQRRGESAAYKQGRNLISLYHTLSWEEVKSAQEAKTQALLRFAREKIPFYGRRWRGNAGLGELNDCPLLTKEEARQASTDLLQDEEARRRHFIGRTSGSTGTPFEFRLSLDSLQLRFGMRDGFYEYHGFDFAQRNLRLGGRLFVAADCRRPPFWVRDYVTNQLLFSVYHLGDHTMPAFVKAVEHYSPYYVTGYPSAIHLMAEGCLNLGSKWKPKAVFTDSESVLDFHRKMVRHAWNCSIWDYYGMEVGWVAGQCKKGKYHLSPLTSVVELVGEDGQPSAEGELGEMVVTDLTNSLMPLIRYRTGDLAVWSAVRCGCGWNTPTLERIEGRCDDVVVLADGRKIGRLDHILKQAEGIREAQLIQETTTRFTLLVIPEPGFSNAVADAIRSEALARLGQDVEITIMPVSALERTRSQKLRSVISKVSRQHSME